MSRRKRKQTERERKGEDCSVVVTYGERVQVSMELGRCVPIREVSSFQRVVCKVLLELDLKMCPY